MKNKSKIPKNISVQILNKLYSEDTKIELENGEEIQIPKDGSLGLLASGYKGIVAWKKVNGIIPNFEIKENNE